MDAPWIARAVAWWLVAACAACGPFEPTFPSSRPPPDAYGTLVCGAPAEACGTACVDLLTDPNHCGRCDRVCESGVCRFGTCTCPSGRIDDGTRCVPAQPTSPGASPWGRTCPSDARSENGRCVCPNPAETACASSCVDLTSDNSNCGVCGHPCTGVTSCHGGQCVCSDERLSVCGSSCIDTRTNPFHCGGCYNSCDATQTCQAGQCVCSEPGAVVCGATCANTANSIAHCGRCGNPCHEGQLCRAGSCVCMNAGETSCGGSCVDLRVNVENCGTCGRACPAGMLCGEGRCIPRPTEPFSGARVARSPLTFRWNNDGARVQVCADRACARVVQTLTSSTREARLTEALEPGMYFWRLQSQDGAVASDVVWPLRVDARRPARPGLLPPDFDLDGDGLADVVVIADGGMRTAVFFGTRGMLSATPDTSLTSLGRNTPPIESAGDVLGAGSQSLRARGSTNTSSWPVGRSMAISLRAPSGARAVFDVNNDGWGDYVGTWLETNQLQAWFGTAPSTFSSGIAATLRTLTGPASTAGVGDVNGDGFSDVLVGSAPRAWVYYGSSTGLDRSSVVPVAPRSDGFGESVSAAGDLNGDGYADLLVRVRRVGAAVYLGGPTVTLHRWIASPTGDDLVVSRAGDVNGDGYGDLVAVPVTSGAAWLYLGGAMGLPEGPTVLRDAAWAGADGTLAAPGDINGDGLDDVYFGVPSSDEVRVLYGAASAPLTRFETLRGAPGSEFGLAVLE